MLTTPSAPTTKTLLLLGEAPGQEEEATGTPFVGPSGQLLRQTIFPMAGLDINEWHITNVFWTRPPGNQLRNWTANKTELKKMGLAPSGPPLQKRYLLPQHQDKVSATKQLLGELQSDLIVALGGTAQWLLLGDDRIGTFRGSFFDTEFGCPAISTFHPAAVLREYKMLPAVVMDLVKAREHLAGTLTPPQRRQIFYSPTEDELRWCYAKFASAPARPLGVDIETSPKLGQITTISFAWPELGICIPLWDKDAKPGEENVYGDVAGELAAWRWIDRFAQLPNPKVLQNGLYDMQYLLDAPLPIRLAGQIEDTSLIQHAYQPELRKDLGTLASFYLNEPSWKQMRTSNKDAKQDD